MAVEHVVEATESVRSSPDRNSLRKILEAAEGLPDTFTREDLAVAAWELYPDRFGLQGYTHLPNVQQVYCKLYGVSGLVGRGYLAQIEGTIGVFSLTASGRAFLTNTPQPVPPPEPEPSENDEAFEALNEVVNNAVKAAVAEKAVAVPVERFAQHHRVRLLDIEEACVEDAGHLDLAFFRRNPERHKHVDGAGSMRCTWDSELGTRLNDGTLLPDHDDFDVLDDLVAAGLVTVKRWTATLTDAGWVLAHQYRRERVARLRSQPKRMRAATPDESTITATEVPRGVDRTLLDVEKFCVDYGGRFDEPVNVIWTELLADLVAAGLATLRDDGSLVTPTDEGWNVSSRLRQQLAQTRRG